MARIAYECNPELRVSNVSDEAETIVRPFACTPDKSCLYCCCNAQCCLLIQRRAPKHFWEAWYLWFGVAILILVIVSSVSNYVIASCRQNWMTLPLSGQSINNNNNNNNERSSNEISIHVIPLPPPTNVSSKLFLCAPQSSAMTPIVA